MGQPLLLQKLHGAWLFTPLAILSHSAENVLGTLLVLAGLAGTLWSYAALGNAWRIWVDRRETPARVTSGPYRFVNHPVYLFQVIIVLGTACLLPTPFSFFLLLFLIVLAVIKAADEEAHFRS
jgi:protein-S-isoprenylcysteine O-methyltransferase Ste14